MMNEKRCSGACDSSDIHHSSFITHHLLFSRSAFTLVELLVSVTIITILAGMVLGALWQASERSKEIRTQSTINKLHSAIMARYESYRERRLPIDPRAVLANNAMVLADFDTMPPITDVERPSLIRLLAMRELMRMEMPDRYKDLEQGDFIPKALVTGTGSTPIRPALWHGYRDRIRRNAVAKAVSIADDDALDTYMLDNTAGGIADSYESAECLYLIVTSPFDDPPLGLDNQPINDVGDADEDGMLEFHDAWGKPIEFFRWAPGVVSELQPLFPGLMNQRDPLNYHDGVDTAFVDRRFNLDSSNVKSPPVAMPNDYFRGYALTPLIVSAGVDGVMNLAFLRIPNTAPEYLTADLDPYAIYNDTASTTFYQRGEPLDNSTEHLDNIHNHLLSTR